MRKIKDVLRLKLDACLLMSCQTHPHPHLRSIEQHGMQTGQWRQIADPEKRVL